MNKCKKFLIIVAGFTLIFLLLSGVNIANAESYDSISPTYLADFGMDGNDLVSSLTLSSDLDTKNAELTSEFVLKSATDKVLYCCVPVYGNYFEMANDKISLTVNEASLDPILTFAKNIVGSYTELTYGGILGEEIIISELDMSLPCYSYEFVSKEGGTVEFDVKEDAVIFTMFNNYSSDSMRRYKLNVKNEKQGIITLISDIEIIEKENVLIERKEITLSDFYNEAVESNLLILNEMRGKMSKNAVRSLVLSRLSEAMTHMNNRLDKIIFAVFDNGVVYYKFLINIIDETTIINITQPFNSMNDYSAKPAVQNFCIMSRLKSDIKMTTSTNKYIVQSNLQCLAKNGNIVEYEGKLPEKFIFSICDSEHPQFEEATNDFPIWKVFIILGSCLVAIVAISLIILFINKKIKR